MLDDDLRRRLIDRLDASRRALLGALEGVTERDFATRLDGGTVTQLLAATALAERQAVAEARGGHIDGRVPERPLPPQVIHDLAGARYQTHRYLEGADAGADVAETLVRGIEEREADAARRIQERPPLEPPPVIPVIQP